MISTQSQQTLTQQYKLIKSAGKGGSCTVYKAKNRTTGEVVALKVFKTLKEEPLKIKSSCKSEMATLKALEHPHILAVKDTETAEAMIENNCYVLPMEYCSKGDLSDILAEDSSFGEIYGSQIFKQLVSALNHSHERQIYNRDIKPENIIINADYQIKLADWGFSVNALGDDGRGNCTKVLGTRPYCAPELITLPEGSTYDPAAADVFSLAVTLYVLVNRDFPFTEADAVDSKHYNWLAQKKYQKFWEFHENRSNTTFSNEFKDLFEKMTKHNPSSRITLEEVERHPWFTQQTCNDEALTKEIRRKIKKIAKEKAAAEEAANNRGFSKSHKKIAKVAA